MRFALLVLVATTAVVYAAEYKMIATEGASEDALTIGVDAEGRVNWTITRAGVTSKYPVLGTYYCPSGSVLQADGSGGWACATIPGLGDELDHVLAGNCSVGDIVKYNSSGMAACGSDDDLARDLLPTLSDGTLLEFDGTNWVEGVDNDTLPTLPACTSTPVGEFSWFVKNGTEWQCRSANDSDVLGSIVCAVGQTAKVAANGQGFVCAQDEDTLGALNCTGSTPVPKYNGVSMAWECSTDIDTFADIAAECAQNNGSTPVSRGIKMSTLGAAVADWACERSPDPPAASGGAGISGGAFAVSASVVPLYTTFVLNFSPKVLEVGSNELSFSHGQGGRPELNGVQAVRDGNIVGVTVQGAAKQLLALENVENVKLTVQINGNDTTTVVEANAGNGSKGFLDLSASPVPFVNGQFIGFKLDFAFNLRELVGAGSVYLQYN